MQISHEMLIESKSIRTEKLKSYSDTSVLDALNKVKPLKTVYFKNKLCCTTEQLADFYNVSLRALQNLIERHSEKFEGKVEKITGKELQQLKFSVNLSKNAPKILLWSLHGVCQAAFLLRDSETASQVRVNLGHTKIVVSFSESTIESFAVKTYGGKRQNILESKKRTDIQDENTITEIKKRVVTARDVGQLFEYLVETEKKGGRLIGKSFSVCAKKLVTVLNKNGYKITLVTYAASTSFR